MNFIYKLERKFGRYAIHNLSLVLILCYIAGYILTFVDGGSFLDYLYLDPYAIAHGQVWRIISWILIPPNESSIFFAVIMLLFYYSIGTTLERTWGAFQYNVYLFSGMILTVLGSFLMMGFCYIFRTQEITKYAFESGRHVYEGASAYFRYLSTFYSTYYVNMSIFLAYAATFPDDRVLLMFLIPIKVKWLGIADAAFLVYEMVSGVVLYGSLGFVYPFAIGSSLLNFVIFFFTTRRYIRMNRAQRKRHNEYKKMERKRRVNEAGNITKHRCAVCGRTERDGDNLTFRFCSKCEGNYEFCQDHLYTHIHFTKNQQ